MSMYSYIKREDDKMSIKQPGTDLCSCNVMHKNLIDKIKRTMPSEEVLYDLADFFKVFGDTTRVRIICVLLKEEMCVCDISMLLGMSQSAISHQLRILRQARIVKFRKEGRAVYYSLDDEHVKNIFEQGFIHINHK